MDKEKRIRVIEDGPYFVSGDVPLNQEELVVDEEGYPIGWKFVKNYSVESEYYLCRCGKSSNKPFCDGTHSKIDFNGRETASRKSYINQAEKIEGPGLDLTDASSLCISAGFCSLREGNVWDLTLNSDNSDAKKIAIKQACDCPAGRLVAWEKNGKPIEPIFEKSITLIEEPRKKVSGAIWVKGGIPIESSDGFEYGVRNRVTLCRCGESSNKPFCDGTHRKCVSGCR